MTKKDYELIASAIRNATYALLYASVNPNEIKRSVSVVTDYIGISLQNNNPRFDMEKFTKTCTVGR